MRNIPLDELKLEEHRCIAVDVDGTLILNSGKAGAVGEPNTDLVLRLIRWKRRSPFNTLIVWSGAGRRNAEMAVQELHLGPWVDAILPKPTAIIDDIADWFDEQSVMVLP